MARAKKRANGYYEIKYNGKSYYGKTLAVAKAKVEQAKQVQKQGYTFQQVVDSYIALAESDKTELRRGTYRSYLKHIKKLEAEFSETPMQDIDAQRIRIFLEKLKAQGYALKSVTNCRSVLSCLFTHWCTEMHGTKNPVSLAGLPSNLQRGERQPPTDQQIQIINAHPEGVGWWAVLFKCTGIRIGEANALRWSDWDWDAGVIIIDDAMPWDRNQPYHEDTKSSAGHRIVPILNELRRIAQPICSQHAATDYCLSGGPKPLTESCYTRQWTNYCRSIGLASSYKTTVKVSATSVRPARTVNRIKWRADVTAHQFRHLFATALFESGVPEEVAQTILGHADIVTTKRVYQHIRKRMIDASVARLNLYFDNQQIS